MKKDYAIQVASSNLRYGIGVTNEVGMDFKEGGFLKDINSQINIQSKGYINN